MRTTTFRSNPAPAASQKIIRELVNAMPIVIAARAIRQALQLDQRSDIPAAGLTSKAG